jgi:hypothetical protein
LSPLEKLKQIPRAMADRALKAIYQYAFDGHGDIREGVSMLPIIMRPKCPNCYAISVCGADVSRRSHRQSNAGAGTLLCLVYRKHDRPGGQSTRAPSLGGGIILQIDLAASSCKTSPSVAA